MNILLVHQYYLESGEGGGSRFNEMVKYWSSKGHKITVLAGMVHYTTGLKAQKYKGKYIVRQKESGNVTVIRTHVSEAYNKNFLGRLWAYFSFVFSGIWGGLFYDKQKHDIVLVTSPPLFVGIIGYVLSRLKRLPLIFEVRDLWPESAIDTGVLTNKYIIKFAFWFERFIYSKSNKINTLTPAFQKNLIEEKVIKPEKVVMIPNAADFELSDQLISSFDREAFRNKMGWKSKKVFIYVGAHGVANHLIQIIETARKMTDPGVHFVLVGDGMEKKMLVAEKEKYGLSNVQFISGVSKAEVFQYILSADVGISVLKKVDTFKTIYSNKTFDYMACKKPVLMAIDGVSRKLIESANAGVYVEPENTDDFVEKITTVLSDKSALNKMGENGYIFAKQNFDRKVLAGKYLDVFENCI